MVSVFTALILSAPPRAVAASLMMAFSEGLELQPENTRIAVTNQFLIRTVFSFWVTFSFALLPLPRRGPRGGYFRSCCCPHDMPTHTAALLMSSTEFPQSMAWPTLWDLQP